MKNVQISQELFMQLLRFHLMEDVGCESEIKQELEKKLDKMDVIELAAVKLYQSLERLIINRAIGVKRSNKGNT